MDPKLQPNRERILQVAERIFVAKGYDGARVDVIAGEAQVNKALIYYYFRSKRALLQELFQRFFRESAALLVGYVQHGGLDGAPSPEADRIFDLCFAYFEEKRDLLRIMLMESLKSEEEPPPVFKLVDLAGVVDEDTIKSVRDSGLYPPGTTAQALVAEFFTGVVPMLFFVLFRDQWSRHFATSKEELRRYFDRAMETTHGEFHRAARQGRLE